MLYNSNNFAVRLCFFLGRIQHNQKCQVDSVTGEIICFSSHHSQECQVDSVTDGWHSCVSVQLHSQKCQVDSVIGELMCFSSHHSQECQVDGVAGDLICVQFYFAICYLVFRTNRLFFVKKEPITLLLFLEKWITLFFKAFHSVAFF